MVVEEDIGAIIIRLKCQVKILETNNNQQHIQEVQGQPKQQWEQHMGSITSCLLQL